MNEPTFNQIKDATLKLLAYCQKENWAGYDPYDALNSKLFAATPFYRSKYCRIALTQLLKRLPINIRPFLLINKEQNPKALALFLMSFVKLKKLGLLPDDSLVQTMVDRLIALRSPDALLASNLSPSTSRQYYCWGYSFPWQGREVLVPRGTPNLVCTVFVANALLDLYELSRSSCDSIDQLASDSSPSPSREPYLQPSTSTVSDSFASSREGGVPLTSSEASLSREAYLQHCFDMALSAAEYILNELYWEDDEAIGFSYPLPSIRAEVHNANFLAAALLCRIYRHSGNEEFLEPALKAVRYSAAKQNTDGSWYYGEHPTQHWIDNFHTGYNLCAIQSIRETTGSTEFDPRITLGFEFYRDHFFKKDKIPKYFHDRAYPIDIHSVAQSLITLLTLKGLQPDRGELAFKIFQWTQSHMCNGSGFFFYQDNFSHMNRISYMRWSQAWMLLALTTLLEATADN